MALRNGTKRPHHCGSGTRYSAGMTGSPALLFASLGHALFHIIAALFMTLVLVLEPIWQRPYDELIALWTWGALLLGLGAPLAGWLGDRIGETAMMLVFFFGIGVASIVCGLSEGPAGLAVGLTLIGLFGAIYHPVGTAWVVKHAAHRGRAIAVVGISGSVGAALASTIAGGIADLSGWRLAFILPGVLALAGGLALTVQRIRGRAADRDSDAAPAAAEPDRREVKRAFFVLIITMTLTSLMYTAFGTMLPKWMAREIPVLGNSLTAVGLVVTLIYLIGASAQLLGGHYADRGLAKAIYASSFALKLGALLAAAAFGGWPVVIAAIVVVWVFDIAAPVENVLIARYTPTRRRGLAYGVRHGIAIVAGPLGVQLVAFLFDPQSGFTRLLYALAAIAAVMVLVALLLPGERRTPAAAPA
jgi:MFS transporter, FSR family, fosmidomycin resistance protein